MNFLTRPITSEKLEAKGQSLYKLGKIFMFCGLCAVAVLLIVVMISSGYGAEGIAITLSLAGFGFDALSAFGSFMALVSYIGIILGIAGTAMYFQGLHIFALGRIAHNTEKADK